MQSDSTYSLAGMKRRRINLYDIDIDNTNNHHNSTIDAFGSYDVRSLYVCCIHPFGCVEISLHMHIKHTVKHNFYSLLSAILIYLSDQCIGRDQFIQSKSTQSHNCPAQKHQSNAYTVGPLDIVCTAYACRTRHNTHTYRDTHIIVNNVNNERRTQS